VGEKSEWIFELGFRLGYILWPEFWAEMGF